ncbi:MAG: hypothetical protein ACK5H2_04325 [Beutenbergiaceae bacterium]
MRASNDRDLLPAPPDPPFEVREANDTIGVFQETLEAGVDGLNGLLTLVAEWDGEAAEAAADQVRALRTGVAEASTGLDTAQSAVRTYLTALAAASQRV